MLLVEPEPIEGLGTGQRQDAESAIYLLTFGPILPLALLAGPRRGAAPRAGRTPALSAWSAILAALVGADAGGAHRGRARRDECRGSCLPPGRSGGGSPGLLLHRSARPLPGGDAEERAQGGALVRLAVLVFLCALAVTRRDKIAPGRSSWGCSAVPAHDRVLRARTGIRGGWGRRAGHRRRRADPAGRARPRGDRARSGRRDRPRSHPRRRRAVPSRFPARARQPGARRRPRARRHRVAIWRRVGLVPGRLVRARADRIRDLRPPGRDAHGPVLRGGVRRLCAWRESRVCLRRWRSRSESRCSCTRASTPSGASHRRARCASASRCSSSSRWSEPAPDAAGSGRESALTALGLASVWSIESFGMTSVTLAALVCVEAALASRGERSGS